MKFMLSKEKGRITMRLEDNGALDMDLIPYKTQKYTTSIDAMPGVKVLARKDNYDIQKISMTPTAFSKVYEDLPFGVEFGLEEGADPIRVLYHQSFRGELAAFSYTKAMQARLEDTIDHGYLGSLGLLTISGQGSARIDEILSNQDIAYPTEATFHVVEEILTQTPDLWFVPQLREKLKVSQDHQGRKERIEAADIQKRIDQVVEKKEDQILGRIYGEVSPDYLLSPKTPHMKLADLKIKDQFAGLDCGFVWAEVQDLGTVYELERNGEGNYFTIKGLDLPYFNSSLGKRVMDLVIDEIQEELDVELVAIQHLD